MEESQTKRHIKRVRLENFQSYEDATINLSPGINLFTGSSDHGKTAFVRALKFVMHNVWSPEYLRIGAEECRVTLWFSDGAVVQRIKGERRNTVMVRYANGQVETFDKIGNKLPLAVIKALGNPPEDESHGAISFAEQLEPMFMVSLNTSDLPRNISELTDIDDLDEASTLLSRRAKSADKQAKELLKRINRFEAELTEYEGLDEKLEVLERLEKSEKRIDDLLEEINAGNDIIRRYSEVMKEGVATSKALKHAQVIAEFGPVLRAIMDKVQCVKRMSTIYDSFQSIGIEITECQAALDAAENMARPEFKKKLSEIHDIQETVQKINDIDSAFKSINQETLTIQNEISALEQNIREQRQIAEDHINTLKDKGFWCPTCNRPLVEDLCQK